jgi:hypothetical protein
MFKKAILAASVALAMGNASAVMITPNASNELGGELFLFAADSSNLGGGPVAVFDLGLLRSNAGPSSAWAQGASGTLSSNGLLSTTTYDFSGTTAWQSFTGAVSSGNRVWGVVGADSTSAGPSFSSVLFTSSVGTGGNLSNTRIVNSANSVQGFQSANNSFGTHSTATDGSGFVAAPALDAAANQVTGLSGGSLLGRSVNTAVGSNQFFYQANATSQGGPTLNVPLAKYTFQGADSYFNLSNAGVLTWNVSAIPEPGEYAMLAVGLAMVGAIARRRRQSI